MRRLIPAVFVAAMLAACSESPTNPEATTAPEQRPSSSVTVPGTTIAINSISCSLLSSTKGDVLCSYNVSNPNGLLINVMPSARVNIAYQCQNASTGKVVSTGTQERFVSQTHEGVTATTYSATNEPLPTAKLFTTTNPSNKNNPCSGKQIAVVTGYSLQYWELLVWTNTSSACAALDSRRGCKVL
jgi:hypothetical protein